MQACKAVQLILADADKDDLQNDSSVTINCARGRPRIKGRFVRLAPGDSAPAGAAQGPDPSAIEEPADVVGASDCDANGDSEG